MTKTDSEDTPVPGVPPPRSEDVPAKNERFGSPASGWPSWLKKEMGIIPLIAIFISGWSLYIAKESLRISNDSLRFSMGYVRSFEDHDVIAKVLEVAPHLRAPEIGRTNAELCVDLALINKGNQKEIIREVLMCYAQDTNISSGVYSPVFSTEQMNFQLDKGERRVMHMVDRFHSLNTGKGMWLGVIVRAIDPKGDDIQVAWPVCPFNLAPDGNGASVSYSKDQMPQIRVISNERLPHQMSAPQSF